MKTKILFLIPLFILGSTFCILAQEDLLDILEEQTEETIEVTTATFKATRIMNGHSIERMPEGQLDARIHRRFGRLNTGAYEFFGIDQAEIHLGLEYGITDWVMIGIGRGNYQKTYDGFAKFSILRQSSGAKNIPVSLSAFTSIAINSLRWQDPVRDKFSNRLTYTGQILVARKFNERLSLQLSPTLVHRNFTFTELEPKDLFALGAGGRFKITSRVSFNAEYYYVFAENKESYPIPIYNPLSLGFDIETGGHVFQLIFTNSVQMIEKGFITETTGQWGEGDVHFGFNISRVFTIY
jgi:hypothetical protein